MSLEQWIKDFPVMTRIYMSGALLTTAACALDLISPFSLYYSLPLIINKHQYYRLVTNFFFFGQNFSADFLFHMFFLVRYCRALEEGSFRGRTADFCYLIILGATALSIIAPLVNLHFLGSSLTFMMVYVWARRNPFARMNFLGLFTFTAPYLPWVLLGLSVVLGNSGTVDAVGIAVGHVYYFLEDVYPLMIPSRRRILKTPKIMFELIGARDDRDDGDRLTYHHVSVCVSEMLFASDSSSPRIGIAANNVAAVAAEVEAAAAAADEERVRERAGDDDNNIGAPMIDLPPE